MTRGRMGRRAAISERNRGKRCPQQLIVGSVKGASSVEGVCEIDRVEHGRHLAGVERFRRGVENVPILQLEMGLRRAQGFDESKTESFRDEQKFHCDGERDEKPFPGSQVTYRPVSEGI